MMKYFTALFLVKRQSVVYFCFLLLMFPHGVQASDFPKGRVVDLTHAFDSDTIYWPTESGFSLEKKTEGYTEKGYFYASNRFSAPEHGGTHIDAPRHFSEKGLPVDQIPLEQLMGPGVVVDVSKQCSKDRDYQIATGDFLEWEKQNGKIPEESIVLLKTGFGSYWPDRNQYMGTSERGKEAVAKLHFPGLHPDATRWLVHSRRIKAVGLDTPSIDYGQSALYGSHVALAEKNVPNFENLANLDKLPLQGFNVIALPLKIKGGSGGPARIIAVIPEE